MTKLPLKTRIYEYVLEKGKPVSFSEVVEAMESEYKGERFCNPKQIENYLLSLCGVKIIEAVFLQYEENQEPSLLYRITEFGKTYQKVLPNYSA